MNRRGFTIIELTIIITVMGILLTLGVVNLSGAQANARDAERKTDIETIAQHLDNYYSSGSDFSTTVGNYPSTSLTATTASMTQAFRDIDVKSLTAPNITDPTLTFISATNSLQTTGTILPQPTINQYVYQPIATDGSLCNDSSTKECRKFNLYYRSEADNTVYMVTSKNQ